MQTLKDQNHDDINIKIASALKYMSEADMYENELILPTACWLDNLVTDINMKWTQPIHFVDTPLIVDNIVVKEEPIFNIIGGIKKAIYALYTKPTSSQVDGLC